MVFGEATFFRERDEYQSSGANAHSALRFFHGLTEFPFRFGRFPFLELILRQDLAILLHPLLLLLFHHFLHLLVAGTATELTVAARTTRTHAGDTGETLGTSLRHPVRHGILTFLRLLFVEFEDLLVLFGRQAYQLVQPVGLLLRDLLGILPLELRTLLGEVALARTPNGWRLF